jgi:hypothetical protein
MDTYEKNFTDYILNHLGDSFTTLREVTGAFNMALYRILLRSSPGSQDHDESGCGGRP